MCFWKYSNMSIDTALDMFVCVYGGVICNLQAGDLRSHYQPSQLFHSLWVLLPPHHPSPPLDELPSIAPPDLPELLYLCDGSPLLVSVQVSVRLGLGPGTVTRWIPQRWGSGPDGQLGDCLSCSIGFLSDKAGTVIIMKTIKKKHPFSLYSFNEFHLLQVTNLQPGISGECVPCFAVRTAVCSPGLQEQWHSSCAAAQGYHQSPCANNELETSRTRLLALASEKGHIWNVNKGITWAILIPVIRIVKHMWVNIFSFMC